MWKIISGSFFLILTMMPNVFVISASVSNDTLLICEVIASSTLAFGVDEVFRKKKQ